MCLVEEKCKLGPQEHNTVTSDGAVISKSQYGDQPATAVSIERPDLVSWKVTCFSSLLRDTCISQTLVTNLLENYFLFSELFPEDFGGYPVAGINAGDGNLEDAERFFSLEG